MRLHLRTLLISPSRGALITLHYVGFELNYLALIGIVLLLGIVMKNGIMLVDFAVAAERNGIDLRIAIERACVDRFRPILMTTLTALLGWLPLAFATGVGAEYRRPLGVTIVGGLILSQILTFYVTPSLYLMMNKSRSTVAVARPGRGRPTRVSSISTFALQAIGAYRCPFTRTQKLRCLSEPVQVLSFM